jgi:hypothetical protein
MGVNFYFRDRLFEWVATVGMLLTAAEIVYWPETIQASSFHLLLYVITPGGLSVFLGVFGVMRVTALVANGSWPDHGPRLRAMGAGSAAFIWAQMGMALAQSVAERGTLSPGVPIYLVLTLGEIFSAYRAMGDARLRT